MKIASFRTLVPVVMAFLTGCQVAQTPLRGDNESAGGQSNPYASWNGSDSDDSDENESDSKDEKSTEDSARVEDTIRDAAQEAANAYDEVMNALRSGNSARLRALWSDYLEARETLAELYSQAAAAGLEQWAKRLKALKETRDIWRFSTRGIQSPKFVYSSNFESDYSRLVGANYFPDGIVFRTYQNPNGSCSILLRQFVASFADANGNAARYRFHFLTTDANGEQTRGEVRKPFNTLGYVCSSGQPQHELRRVWHPVFDYVFTSRSSEEIQRATAQGAAVLDGGLYAAP